MKRFLIIALLLTGLVRQTETIKGHYYPNAYEVDDFTDMGLELLEGGN